MLDRFGRNVDYLRISITDKCNLRCLYCMPEKGNTFCSDEKKLSNDEIQRIVNLSSKLGIRKVRLTGGEPLVMDGVVDLIKNIDLIDGIEEIAITTNGILLDDKIEALSKCGLKKVNISLDTLNKDKYFKITRGGNLSKVLSAIDKGIKLGIKIKLNTVIVEGINDDEILDLIDLTKKIPVDVRFIELMPIGEGKKFKGLSNENILKFITESNIEFEEIKRNSHDGPAEYIKLKEALGRVGFISAMSNCFCKDCNRMRITTDGYLKQCLNWKSEINLKSIIKSGANDEEIKDIIEKAIYNKPEKYLFKSVDENKEIKFMNEIGG